jgi:hypothetical protein
MARGRSEGKNGTPSRSDAGMSTQQRSSIKEEGEESGGFCNGRQQAYNRQSKGEGTQTRGRGCHAGGAGDGTIT